MGVVVVMYRLRDSTPPRPKGPVGFENRPTFNIIGRDKFGHGLPIRRLNSSAAGTWLATSAFSVFVPAAGACTAPLPVADQVDQLRAVTVTTPSGRVLYRGVNTGNSSKVLPSMLHWPSPLEAPAYAFADYPRFTVPAWGPTPIPAGANVTPGARVTNGYDFSNSQPGDTYIFLLGESLQAWWTSRAEFLQLTGPTPLLPDFTFGVWYTWYSQYTESRAKDEIGNWTRIRLPLDAWGLDMNWRNVGAAPASDPGEPASIDACHSQNNSDPSCRDHYYDHPNRAELPGLTMGKTNEWFSFIKSQNLSTYFNGERRAARTRSMCTCLLHMLEGGTELDADVRC